MTLSKRSPEKNRNRKRKKGEERGGKGIKVPGREWCSVTGKRKGKGGSEN
jgi:hypothetical protein